MGAYRKLLPVHDLYALFWYVHPGSILTVKILHIKALKTIILELRMFSRQSNSFNLKCQSIQFRISRSKNFPFRMCGNKQKPILV